MRKLLNTLYVTSPNTYLSLDGENIVILKDETEASRIPLHNLEGIITFGYTGASPALMGACSKHNIALSFMTESGRFRARVVGEVRGNVTLRKAQYRISDVSVK
jgi:CRISP-associated protein Cas1